MVFRRVADAVVVPPELASDGFLERVLYLAAPLSFFLVEDYPDLDSPELSADAQPAQALAQAYLPPGLADDEGGVLEEEYERVMDRDQRKFSHGKARPDFSGESRPLFIEK